MTQMMKLAALSFACASMTMAAEWGAPVDVLHDFKPCVTYRAKIEGDVLAIEATIQPGWHTFAIDNEQRAAEKLAGKASLGIDQPTKIKVGEGVEVTGPWFQTAPKDFSKPAMRWYSFGFEGQAMFAAKVHSSGSGPAQIELRGQACTDKTCKNIDVMLSAPVSGKAGSIDLKTLVQTK
jgi:hypothetical protein